MQCSLRLVGSFLLSFIALNASATNVPTRTIFTNSSTSLAVTATPNPLCPGFGPCYAPAVIYGWISWSQPPFSTTHTLATVLFVVNHKSNATRTTTIYNTEIDTTNYTTPSTLNAESTATTTVVYNFGTTNSTQVIAFPSTAYQDYDSTYDVWGAIPTTINGISTCTELASENAKTTAYPSHPLLPSGVQDINKGNFSLDPRGWSYTPVLDFSATCGNLTNDTLLQPLIPDAFIWNCYNTLCPPAADAASPTALFITTTSTSTEGNSDTPSSSEVLTSAAAQSSAPESREGTPETPQPDLQSSTPTPAPPSPAPPSPSPQSTPPQPTPTPSPSPESTPAPPPATSSEAPPPSSPPTPPASSAAPLPVSPPPAEQSTNAPPPILQTSGTQAILISNSISSPLSVIATPSATALPPIVLGSQTVTPNSQSQYILPSSLTLAANTPVTLGTGTTAVTLAISTSGSQAVFISGTVTSPLKLITPSSAVATTAPPVLTVAGESITANSQGMYVVGSQTLSPGGVATVSGTRVSLEAGGSGAVVGTSTEALGSVIMGAFGPGGGSTGTVTGTGGAVAFTGGAPRVVAVGWLSWGGVVLGGVAMRLGFF